MKKIAQLIKGISLKFVKMKDLSISIFFDKYCFSCSMLVAHSKIVIESKLNRRCYSSTMVRLPNDNILPLFFPTLLDQLQKYPVHTLTNSMGNDWLLSSELFIYLQEIHLNFIVRQITQQNKAFRNPKLTVHFSSSRIVEITLAYFEWAAFIINLSSTVEAFAVSFGNHKIFPALVKVRLVNMFYLNAFRSESVSNPQIGGVDNSGRTHDPVRYSCEIFYEVQ